MHTDVDLENELLHLAVEELVRAGLRTPLREPILAAVERTPGEPVEVVVPEGPGERSDTEGVDTEGAAESDASGRGPVTRAARRLVVLAAAFAVLYLARRRLTD